jgi:hypothetical protein
MVFRCRIYTVVPGRMAAFTDLFLNYLFPVQARYGARLVARLQSEDESRVLALWVYESMEEYHRIQGKVEADPDSHRAREYRDQHLGKVYSHYDEFFLTSTVPLEITQLAHLLTREQREAEEADARAK